MMRNFDTELDRRGVTRMTVSEVTETVTVKTPTRKTAEISHSMVPDDQWGWREVRDYVVTEIEKRTGPFPRVEYKEASIFKRFCREWGEQASLIARFAFEVEDGKWGGAPISINRFSMNSDPFFAKPIAERLASDDLIQAWA